jgi:deoxyribodipyrimidine photo-lyase
MKRDQPVSSSVALWWIRRDLRLSDNQTLAAALAGAEQVVPVFVLDPALWKSPHVSEKRLAFLLGGLRKLDADLRARGSRLIVRQGGPKQELAALMAETGADRVFAEQDYSRYACQRDAKIARHLPLRLISSLTVHPPAVVLKADGEPYTVFTPFSRAWKVLTPPSLNSVLPAPERICTANISSEAIPPEPVLPLSIPFVPGEAEAQHRLGMFLDQDDPAIYRYGEGRNRMDWDGTSQLSPYLRFGMLSARQVAVAAYSAIEAAPTQSARASAEMWLNELVWREFYISILYHFPDVSRQAFRAARSVRNIRWRNDEREFAAWCQGRTGYPVVDAAMRQLKEIGWMHNRARMIIASFLVKDLLVDWRWGERWFMQHLVDGDPAANNGGWQWTAGVGTDAAPYFRVFNPVLQGTKFDPQGGYVRRWVPALADVPDKFIHKPWEMSVEVQRTSGCVIGQDYPAPMVDHAPARARALAAYRHAQS